MSPKQAGTKGIRGRRWVGLGAGIVLIVLGATAAGAAGGIELTPSSGDVGTPYTVEVECGQAPLVYQGFAQGDYVPGTIGPRPPDEVIEVTPSIWQVEATAGEWDTPWYATCDGVEAGNARFDTENPQLWFGPRPSCCGWNPLQPRTTLEGTDCPPQAAVTVSFTVDGADTGASATADAYGDWSVPLPGPLGSQELTIEASCGQVRYASMTVTTTSTTTPSTPTTETTAPSPGESTPPPATPQPGTATFTG